jgi:ATP-dependent Lon protease
VYETAFGNTGEVKKLLERGATVDYRTSPENMTPLIIAASSGYTDIVTLLIQYKAQINARMIRNDTALKWAAYNGHLETVKVLLRHKADIHVKDVEGYTALLDAARRGYHEIAKLLLSNGANVNDMDNYGRTAYSIAKQHNFSDVMQVLVDFKADTELGDEAIEKTMYELIEKVLALPLSKEAKKELRSLIRQMEQNPHGSEKGNIKAYLDFVFALPWDKKTVDNLDLVNAKKVLDADHYGLKDVKEKILDYIATLSFSKTGKAPIICLVGPPGIGKTSLCKSIATALGRKYERMAVGGLHDEAELRGHRRTYIGARPGRIVAAIKKAESLNPLIVIDEIDKMSGSNYHGDPYAAMLEILDPEQNNNFRDNYLEIPMDLSQVLFIATANDASAIPHALRDRMEIIYLSSYSHEEKLEIAQHHLVQQAVKDAGLESKKVIIQKEVLMRLIKDYSHEAGVRQVKRNLAKLMSKIARALVEQKKMPTLDVKTLEKYLGPALLSIDDTDHEHRIGVCNGLYASYLGGGATKIEALLVPRSASESPLTVTGQLHTIAQESAQTVLSYARSIAPRFGITNDPFATHALHLNWSDKTFSGVEGPSAGIAMLTATISAITGKQVNAHYAMTGALNLRGYVMPIGGLKDKILGAKRCGMKYVIIPHENKRDLDELDEYVTNDIKIIMVKHVDEVLKMVLM